MNIFKEAAGLQDSSVTFAMATIISAEGSTPRNHAKMLVLCDGSIRGTIGGGLIEAYVIKEATAAIRERRSRVVEYILNSSAPDGIQMLCGGKTSIFIEVNMSQPKIAMIGAGHVGLAIYRLAELLGYRVTMIDNRQEFANSERYPNADRILCDGDMAKAIEDARIDSNTYVVIATADSDMDALTKVLEYKAAYIGMIGSRRKTAVVLAKLQESGMDPVRLKSVHAPIGLDIGSETPEEIAVSIMAEIMKVRNGRTGASMKELTGRE